MHQGENDIGEEGGWLPSDYFWHLKRELEPSITHLMSLFQSLNDHPFHEKLIL